MTIADQIMLIDQMIKENPEYVIRDYLDMLTEIDNIKPDDMNKPLLYTPEQAEFMIKNCQEWTARELAEGLKISESTVRNFGSRYRLTFKPETGITRPRQEKAVKEPETRPEATYSNNGFLSISKKYMV